MKRFVLFIVFSLVLNSVEGLAGEKRGVAVKGQKGDAPGESSKTNYQALVIGNNNYRNMPKLKTAVNDAREVDRILREKYGFKTKILTDATRKDILNAVNDFRKNLTELDSFLVYYAGHGEYDHTAEKGYWLPVDAEKDNPTDWIMAEDITSNIKRISARHVLVVADSCYSGTLTRSAGTELSRKKDRQEFLKKMMERPSRTLMASGGNEPVADAGGKGNHSVFASAFLTALKEADKNAFTAEELFHGRVKSIVAGRSEQVPQYSDLRNSGHEGGDFIFRLAQAGEDADTTSDAPAQVTPAPQSAPIAAAAPVARKKSSDSGDYTDAETGMALAFVAGGCFQMGDVFGDGYTNEKPAHDVCIDDLYVGKFEVTVGEFRKFVNDTGYATDADRLGAGCFYWTGSIWGNDKTKNWKNPGFNQSETHPVVCVSWNDANAFAGWLSGKTGKGYRLPTEAEWEFAARNGGKNHKYSWGNGGPKANGKPLANVASRGSLYMVSTLWDHYDDGYMYTAPGGSFPPNELGLYDMIGNVDEWVNDWYGEQYYAVSPRDNPQGPESGEYRSARGDSWWHDGYSSRVSCIKRSRQLPAWGNTDRGFRLVVTAR